MRLYLASHSIGRSPVGDQVVGGYLLPAGSTVVVSTHALHRSLDCWDRPDAFDPGRYEVPDGVVAGGHKHAWMAFGSGPHTCVGMTLATQMVTVVLATLLQQVQLTTALTSVPVHASMTLRPAGALPVEVRR
jgi:cytochrome P450